MATATPVYGTPTAMTITIASLASDTNLLIGRESTALDQKDTLDAVDVMLGGKIRTGTSPTASRQIEIWLYGSYDDSEYTASATGSDAGLTVIAETKTLFRLFTIIPTNNTSDRDYKFGPYSVAQCFGGTLPVQFGVWIVHNTGVNLNSTSGNHEIYYTTVKYESA